jgi:uncharacterized integral membrane protein
MSTKGTETSAGKPLPPWLTRRNIKIAVWVVLLAAVGIIVWQNWISVDMPILFINIHMPQSLLLVLMLVIGFVLGLTVRFRRKSA